MGHALTLLARGEKVGLRRLEPGDAGEDYLRWMNDPEVGRFLESRFAVHTPASLREFVAEQSGRDDTLFLAIVALDEERHVGNIKIGPLSPHHGTADVGLLIGEPAARGRGFGTEAIALATTLGFAELGARKLTASCYSDNVGSINAFKRAGWRAEGARPAQFLADDGTPQDQVMFGILREQWSRSA